MNGSSIDSLKRELELLRRTNLESAGFDNKRQLMGLLNIKVYPTEDLKTVRIRTGLGIDSREVIPDSERDYCGKV